MNVLEAISMFSDNVNITLLKGNNVLSFYDGKNSIDECYNGLPVKTIWWSSTGNQALITIDEEK